MRIKKVRYVEVESVDFDNRVRFELKQGYSSVGDKVLITLEDKSIEITLNDFKGVIDAI